MIMQMETNLFSPVALPYAQDALAPVISAQTVAFHYGKHLQAYINNLNAALPGSGFEGKSIEEIVVSAEGGIFNNAGQVLNHTMYFTQFKPAGAESAPKGALLEAIVRAKKFACGPNCRRLSKKTPCAELGTCADCDSPDRICKVTAVFDRCPSRTSTLVVLVDEDLGY